MLQPSRWTRFSRYVKRNKSLGFGLGLAIFLLLFATVGRLFVNTERGPYPLFARPLIRPFEQPAHPLGTDKDGRDLFAAMVVGVGQTGIMVIISGLMGITIGTVLGFITAYFGGMVDRVIQFTASVLLPIPPFLIQVLLVSSPLIDKTKVSIWTMAAIIVAFAWIGATLVVRSQVLSMRERQYVSVAKLSGMNDLEIIFKEMLPNLLPFLLSQLVGQIIGALGASFGLSVLGLGPLREPLIGNILYYANFHGALTVGWWWWMLWPVLACIMFFLAPTLINVGLDEVANPRVRRSE